VSKPRRLALLVCYAVATFLAFPQPLGDQVIDLGLVFGWLSPALLLAATSGLRVKRAALTGFGAGVLAHAAVLHWIYVTTVTYGHAPPVVGVITPVLLACYVALFSAGFAATAAATPVRGPLRPFVLAAAWVGFDLLRTMVFTGFPWATLGYALHRDLPLLGLAPITGVYGLSFAGALAGAGLFAAATRTHREAISAASGLLLLHAVGGVAWWLAPAHPQEEHVRVGALQGNIMQGQKWNPALAAHIMDVYSALTRRAAAAGAELVLWPETAVPGSPDTDPALRSQLVALARETGAVLVVGAVGIEGHESPDRSDVRFYDSAFAYDVNGTAVDRYDKTHLVPFGEFLPFRALIGRFVSAVATGVTSGDVSAGTRPRALALPVPGGERVLSAGVPICYELLFPDLMRRFAADGARVLLAITNDAWYGKTGAPHQFLVITALRAAESRTYVVRAANTGVTALIDDRGRVREQTRIFERDLLVADVPLAASGGSATFYVRHGDWFAMACVMLALAALAYGVFMKRSNHA